MSKKAFLKMPKCEIFDLLDYRDYFTVKAGNTRSKKICQQQYREVGSRRHASNSKDHSNSWYLRNGAATTKTTATAGT
jgi:hypothetical protein